MCRKNQSVTDTLTEGKTERRMDGQRRNSIPPLYSLREGVGAGVYNILSRAKVSKAQMKISEKVHMQFVEWKEKKQSSNTSYNALITKLSVNYL